MGMQKLNGLQNEMLCIYLNFIGDIKRFCDRKKTKSGVPRNLIFLMNVGVEGSGATHFGSDSRSGCHFTLATIDNISNELLYCASLGWAPPKYLIKEVYD